jgi:K+-sensing histidine kinase KdpD
MKDQLAKLIDVKTIVTFVVTAVLAYLAIKGTLAVDQFMIVAVMIFTYFFSKPATVPPNTTTTTETTTTATTKPPES